MNKTEAKIRASETVSLLEDLERIVQDDLTPYLGHEDEHELAQSIIVELLLRAYNLR